MHYTSKLRVIVCSSLENIAHPVLLRHCAPEHITLALEMHFQTEKKKGTKGGRKGGGGYRTGDL